MGLIWAADGWRDPFGPGCSASAGPGRTGPVQEAHYAPQLPSDGGPCPIGERTASVHKPVLDQAVTGNKEKNHARALYIKRRENKRRGERGGEKREVGVYL